MDNLDPDFKMLLAFFAAHFGHLTWAQIKPAYQWAVANGGVVRVVVNAFWVKGWIQPKDAPYAEHPVMTIPQWSYALPKEAPQQQTPPQVEAAKPETKTP